jgi:glyoxalase superfamily protein
MSISPVSDSPLIVQAKKKAKHLQSILKPKLPEISHGECLNIISRLERERDWNSYLARLKQTGSSGGHGEEVDSYIRKTALPLIVSIATRHNMKVIADPSQLEDGEAKQGWPTPRRISMRIEPQDQQHGDTYCEPFLDVTMTSLRFWSDWINLSLNFIFPKEAFSVVAQLLSGDKVSDDAEPRITRFETQQEQCYMLTVNTSGVSDSVDHGQSILTDSKMLMVLQKGFDRFFAGYGRAVKAYSALQGRWGNKRLVTDFENALWKMNRDDPPYMAVSNRFYSSTIAGLQFHGALGSAGPYIVGADGSIAIGVCSIIYLEDGEEGKPEGNYIAKYSKSSEAEIHLNGFSDSDIDRLTAEFGIPRGHYSDDQTAFYKTPAFNALCAWTEKNPKYAKRVGRNDGRYLPDWYEQVMARKIGEMIKPTEQDFLSAIEKEPYLIDFGIRCNFHIDRKKTAEENKAIFHSQRDSFARSGYREFCLCCEWLKGCTQRKTINTSLFSYRLKHMVEAWAKKTGRDDYYVSNGAFIAAAIHMGFEWKPDFDSPNVRFNISGKSPAITALERAVTA